MGFDTLLFVLKLISHGCFLKLWYILYIVDVFGIFCVLYPCYFCKLLGICFMHVCGLYGVYHAFKQLLCIVYSVLLTKCHAFSF